MSVGAKMSRAGNFFGKPLPETVGLWLFPGTRWEVDHVWTSSTIPKRGGGLLVTSTGGPPELSASGTGFKWLNNKRGGKCS